MLMAEQKLFSSPVLTLSSHEMIHDALVLMQTNFVKRVVITKENKPIGILTERDIGRFLENDKSKRELDEIPLKEIMRKNIIAIQQNQMDHLEQCAMRMVTFKIGSIIIIDDEGYLVGITTQTDIAASFASTYEGKYRVRDYMTEKTVTCRDTDSLGYALEIINKNDVSRLVATDNHGRLQGIITTNNFLRESDYFRGTSRVRNYLLPTEATNNRTVKDLIGREVFTVNPDDDLASAASHMIKNKISGIPVVNSQKKIVGVVTKFDIVRAYSNVIPHGKILERYKTFP